MADLPKFEFPHDSAIFARLRFRRSERRPCTVPVDSRIRIVESVLGHINVVYVMAPCQPRHVDFAPLVRHFVDTTQKSAVMTQHRKLDPFKGIPVIIRDADEIPVTRLGKVIGQAHKVNDREDDQFVHNRTSATGNDQWQANGESERTKHQLIQRDLSRPVPRGLKQFA